MNSHRFYRWIEKVADIEPRMGFNVIIITYHGLHPWLFIFKPSGINLMTLQVRKPSVLNKLAASGAVIPSHQNLICRTIIFRILKKNYTSPLFNIHETIYFVNCFIRTEEDIIGKKEIPQAALYGIHAVRAKENFPDATPFHIEWFRAMGLVKHSVYAPHTTAVLVSSLESHNC